MKNKAIEYLKRYSVTGDFEVIMYNEFDTIISIGIKAKTSSYFAGVNAVSSGITINNFDVLDGITRIFLTINKEVL